MKRLPYYSRKEYAMTASSRGFDEELRARLASLARALRSLKIIKRNEDTASNGQTKENALKIFGECYKIHAKCCQNARRERKGAQRPPTGGTGSEESPTKVQKGRQMEPTAPQRSPKGVKRAPKGNQNSPKMPPSDRDGPDR